MLILQPILTNILSGPILKERVTFVQWFGIILGFIGTVLVIGYDIGKTIPIVGSNCLNSCFTWCNIQQLFGKKFTNKITLSVNNLYQAIAATNFLILTSFIFEIFFINFDNKFILSMGWQIIMVSFGAYAILMYLIKTGTASKTSNLFFLIPPTTAVMAFFILGEKLLFIDIIGLIICTFGVYIATRK